MPKTTRHLFRWDLDKTYLKSDIDSVAALVPRSELEGQMGDSSVGVQARLMSQAMRKLTGICSKSRTAVIFINQIREKIGVMYGSPETTPGGRALKFYCSVRIDVRKIGMLKEGETVIGTRVRTKIVKNKVAPPFRESEFDMLFESGISGEADLLDVAAEAGVVSRSGTWYAYGANKIGQGRDNARLFLRDNPELYREIRAKTLEAKMLKIEPTGEAPSGDAENPEKKADGAEKVVKAAAAPRNTLAPKSAPAKPTALAAKKR